jgi:TonB family protein
VRLSPEIGVPIVCGLRRPVILLPRDAAQWDEARLSVVLAHERMHVERRDTLWQALARWVCAFWWPHPLVWYAASELKKECERACDDGVLVTGVRPSAYAERLLEIARAASAARSYEGGLAMATMSQLEGRLRSVLSAGRNRSAAGVRPALAILAFGGLLAAGVAAMRVPALAQTGELRGVVQDASGARVPKARVLVTSLGGETAIKELVVANEVGEFSFSGLPDGAYEVRIDRPGFARLLLTGIKVGPGAPAPITATLNIGGIQESMSVVGKREGAPGGVAGGVAGGVPGGVKSAAPGAMPSRLRIGGNVQATRLVKQVRPVYPPGCKREGVQGSVFLRAVIGKDGAILNLEPLNKIVDQRLVQAAVDAVKQWRYEPTLLNGNAVEIITEVEISFALQE